MRRLLRLLLPLSILAAGAFMARTLLDHPPAASRQSPPPQSLVVETLMATPGDHTAQVPTQGNVIARHVVTLTPQVSGTLVWVADLLASGRRVEAGAVLARIDERDYRVAVTVAEAEVTRAQATLELERGRLHIAREDWEMLKRNSGSQTPDATRLALREPQHQTAVAALTAARAQLDKARLDLERTMVKAPFDAWVLESQASVGAQVTPGTPLARMYDHKSLELRLPLTSRQMQRLPPPDRDNTWRLETAPSLILSAPWSGRETPMWRGHLDRLEAQVDPTSRNHYALALVDESLGEDTPPLLTGQFFQAVIQGRRWSGVYTLPQSALVGSAAVFVVEEGRLRLRPVEILHESDTQVVIQRGLQPGDRVSITPLTVAHRDQPVRERQEQRDEEPGASQPQRKGRKGSAGPRGTPGDAP
ncbi:MAG: efflux RND transporter periplasmic adaptor subunit [Magnetococcus sp. WYHC-3]